MGSEDKDVCWGVMLVKDKWGRGQIGHRKPLDPNADETPVKGKMEGSTILRAEPQNAVQV